MRKPDEEEEEEDSEIWDNAQGLRASLLNLSRMSSCLIMITRHDGSGQNCRFRYTLPISSVAPHEK